MQHRAFDLPVEAVYDLTGRGTAVIGPVDCGEIRSGDAAALVDELGVVPVRRVAVEIHAPPGKLLVVLSGVERRDVRVGQRLQGPRP